MAYDNMRTAVKKFLGRDREHTDALLRMEVHYCFTPHFCNPRSGWEKRQGGTFGGVYPSACILVRGPL